MKVRGHSNPDMNIFYHDGTTGTFYCKTVEDTQNLSWYDQNLSIVITIRTVEIARGDGAIIIDELKILSDE